MLRPAMASSRSRAMPSTRRKPIITISSSAVSRSIGVVSSIAVPVFSTAASQASGARI
jgi:hypothetical protein